MKKQLTIIFASALTACAGILDAPPLSPAAITNIAQQFSTASFVAAFFPVSTADVYGTTLTPNPPCFGNFYQVAVTTPFTATNVELSVTAINSNTPCLLRVFKTAAPFNSTNYYVNSYTLLYSNAVTVTVSAGSQSFPVSGASFSSGDVAMVTLTCAVSNQIKTPFFANQVANTNGSSSRLSFGLFRSTNNTDLASMSMYPLSYSFAGACPRFGYTQKVAVSDASTTTFTASTTPAFATSAQAGMERLYYPLNPNKVVVVNQGDSKAHIVSYLLFTNDFFTRTVTNIEIASPGTSLAWSKAAWESNAASYYALLTNGMTGIATIWTAHNNITSTNIAGDINTYSNWLVEIIASNYLPVVATCQMIQYTNQPSTNTMAYFVAINNWLRTSPLVWRCVDAEAMFNNNYDTNFFSTDFVHPNGLAAQLIGNEFARQVRLPNKETPAQRWSGNYGTNFYMAAPGNTTVPRFFLSYP